MEMSVIGIRAKQASNVLGQMSTKEKNNILVCMAEKLNEHKHSILSANTIDVEKSIASGLKASMVERLTLSDKAFAQMVEALLKIVDLEDPVGKSEHSWINASGLQLSARRVPLGVVGIIYESRPNVTVDAASLCIKTGNAVILKGGSDAIHTNMAIMSALKEALVKSHAPEAAIQLIESTNREAVLALIEARKYVDCIIPRGGAGLIQFVVEHSKVPVIETGAGNCHIYWDEHYDFDSAAAIVLNAKIQRPGACNAVETLLVHKSHLGDPLKELSKKLLDSGVSLRVCERAQSVLQDCPHKLATEQDWDTEFLDLILAIKVVDDITQAIEHINRHSTGHSEAILTPSYDHALQFHNQVHSAVVYVNSSTRFSDGGEFGFGAEIGISTQKLHARGPMGLSALTTVKYIAFGSGQTRL